MDKKTPADPAMVRILAKFEASEMTLEELGKRMGYPEDTARKSAWQFIRQTSDPRISTLRKAAEALKIPLGELIAETKSRRSK
jgi:transcriptional regulator with XRE-family HTH domain